MKTLDQVKDEQAQSTGRPDWDALWLEIIKHKDWEGAEWNMYQVTKAYAEQAVDQCAEDAITMDFAGLGTFIDRDSILNVKTLLI